MYCALIGDIIDSQLINNRNSIQKKYIEAFQIINQKYEQDIAANFKIRDGDGFHGLLKTTEHVMEIILWIRLALVPVQIRIGIGIGEIDTEINKNEIQEIDGKAFNIARKAMDFAHEQEKKYESISQNTVISFYKSSSDETSSSICYEQVEELINLNFCTCSIIEQSWSEKQAEVIQLKMKELSQREMATELKIKQASVYSRMKLSNFYTYKYCMNQIQKSIDKLWGY